MAKIAARIVPVMTPAEVDTAIRNHYRAEAQTLTTGAEANLLKLAELLGTPTAEEQRRWDEILLVYRRRQEVSGSDDPVKQAVVQLARLGERLDALHGTLADAATRHRDAESDHLERLVAGLVQAVGAARSEPPKIEVVNTLPKYYAQIFDHHLKVIEASLVPVIEILGRYAGSTQTTRAELETIAADLRRLGDRQKGMTYRDTPGA
jgi:phage gp29-like protein